MRRKVITFVIVLVSVISFATVGSYAMDVESSLEEPVIVQYTNISSIKADISISESTAFVTVNVRDNGKKSTKISCTATLQKKSRNSWSNVKNWRKSTEGDSLTISKTKTVSRGVYRVKVTVKAYKGNKSESIIKYSGTKTY